MRTAKERPGRSIIGVARNRLFQECYGFIRPIEPARPNEGFGAEVRFVGFLVLDAIAEQVFVGSSPERYAQRRGDGLRNVLLNPEHVSQIAVVILGPDPQSVIGSHQLRIDADTLSRSANGAGYEVGCAKRLANGASVVLAAF